MIGVLLYVIFFIGWWLFIVLFIGLWVFLLLFVIIGVGVVFIWSLIFLVGIDDFG